MSGRNQGTLGFTSSVFTEMNKLLLEGTKEAGLGLTLVSH